MRISELKTVTIEFKPSGSVVTVAKHEPTLKLQWPFGGMPDVSVGDWVTVRNIPPQAAPSARHYRVIAIDQANREIHFSEY